MGKYDSLREHLKSLGNGSVQMSFSEIADLVGGLPASTHTHSAWWANEMIADGRHVQAKAWLGAGRRVEEVSLAGKRVRFRQSSSYGNI